MAVIVATQTFLHGTERYEEGQRYTRIDPALAAYFVQNGWATSDDVADVLGPQPQDVTLDIQSAVHPAKSSKVGKG